MHTKRADSGCGRSKFGQSSHWKRIRGSAAVAAFLALAAIAASASAATGAPGPHAQSIQLSAAALKAATTAPAAITASVSPANQGYGFCNTPPGVSCTAEYLMTKGTATLTAYGFGPNGAVISNLVSQTCSTTTCIKSAVANPSPGVTVNYIVVTGPNISVICGGEFC